MKQESLPAPDFYKHNDYIKILQVKNQMNINQQKIFDSILSTVQHMKKIGKVDDIIREGDLELDYDIFKSHIMKGSRISKINRKVLKEAMEDMVSIKFSWSTENEVGAVVLFQKGVIDFNTKKVKVTFGKDFRTENLVPSSHYTALSYEYLNKFRSQYTRSLYQYFKMLIGKDIKKPFKTNAEFESNYLKSLLGVNETSHKEYYNNNSSFVKRCIKPAIEEMNIYSDIEVDYEIEKYRNRINLFKFKFKPKKIVNIEIDSTVKHTNTKTLFDVTSFKDFKKMIIETFSGKDICNDVPGFDANIIISLTETGYLKNKNTEKIHSASESLKVWNYLYKNQHRVGDIRKISEKDTQLKLYLEKKFIFNGERYKVESIDFVNSSAKVLNLDTNEVGNIESQNEDDLIIQLDSLIEGDD